MYKHNQLKVGGGVRGVKSGCLQDMEKEGALTS